MAVTAIPSQRAGPAGFPELRMDERKHLLMRLGPLIREVWNLQGNRAISMPPSRGVLLDSCGENEYARDVCR